MQEPKHCRDCPFWSKSDRTPNVGHCTIYDDTTLGHDIPSDLCTTQFWNLAGNHEPALYRALKPVAIVGLLLCVWAMPAVAQQHQDPYVSGGPTYSEASGTR